MSHASGMARFPEERSFVRAALDAVTKMGMVPVEMEHFPAAGTKPADYCRERVAGCEIYPEAASGPDAEVAELVRLAGYLFLRSGVHCPRRRGWPPAGRSRMRS